MGRGNQCVYIYNPGHMIKMAAMPIYGKNPLKILLLWTTGRISTKLGMKHRGLEYYKLFTNYDLWMTLTYLKLGMKHRGLEYYKLFTNYDLWMTLTYFTARST